MKIKWRVYSIFLISRTHPPKYRLFLATQKRINCSQKSCIMESVYAQFSGNLLFMMKSVTQMTVIIWTYVFNTADEPLQYNLAWQNIKTISWSFLVCQYVSMLMDNVIHCYLLHTHTHTNLNQYINHKCMQRGLNFCLVK